MSKEKLKKKIMQIRALLGECERLLSVNELEYVKIHENSKEDSMLGNIDFDADIKAFIKKHVKGKRVSGQQIFTIVLAYLCAGQVDKDVSVADIRSIWSKNSSNFQTKEYQSVFSSRAREAGWVKVSEYQKMSYKLTESWRAALYCPK